MRCMFCNERVFGEGSVSIASHGVAHSSCFEAHQTMRRTFKELDITSLSDAELTDLHDLVLAESNTRKGSGGDEIELF